MVDKNFIVDHNNSRGQQLPLSSWSTSEETLIIYLHSNLCSWTVTATVQLDRERRNLNYLFTLQHGRINRRVNPSCSLIAWTVTATIQLDREKGNLKYLFTPRNSRNVETNFDVSKMFRQFRTLYLIIILVVKYIYTFFHFIFFVKVVLFIV